MFVCHIFRTQGAKRDRDSKQELNSQTPRVREQNREKKRSGYTTKRRERDGWVSPKPNAACSSPHSAHNLRNPTFIAARPRFRHLPQNKKPSCPGS